MGLQGITHSYPQLTFEIPVFWTGALRRREKIVRA